MSVKFHWPSSQAGAHKQYVNLPPGPLPEKGPLLTIEVELCINDGKTVPVIALELLEPGQKWPSKEVRAWTSLPPDLKRFRYFRRQYADRYGKRMNIALFSIPIENYSQCMAFHLFANEKLQGSYSWKDTLFVEPWRKLFIRCYHVFTPSTLPQEVSELVRQAYLPARIEIEFGNDDRSWPIHPGIDTRAFFRRIGPNQNENIEKFRAHLKLSNDATIAITSDPAKAFSSPSCDLRPMIIGLVIGVEKILKPVARSGHYDNCIEFGIGDNQSCVEKKNRYSAFVNVSSWARAPIASLLPYDWDGNSSFIEGSWKNSEGKSIREVVRDEIEFHEDLKRFRVRNSSNENVLVRPLSRCRVKLRGYQPGAGNRHKQWIVVVNNKNIVKYALAIAHEIGHVLGLVPSSLPAGQVNPYHYESDGGHCSSGARETVSSGIDAEKLLADSKPGKRKHGNCIMWSIVSDNYQYDKTIQFCGTCILCLQHGGAAGLQPFAGPHPIHPPPPPVAQVPVSNSPPVASTSGAPIDYGQASGSPPVASTSAAPVGYRRVSISPRGSGQDS